METWFITEIKKGVFFLFSIGIGTSKITNTLMSWAFLGYSGACIFCVYIISMSKKRVGKRVSPLGVESGTLGAMVAYYMYFHYYYYYYYY